MGRKMSKLDHLRRKIRESIKVQVKRKKVTTMKSMMNPLMMKKKKENPVKKPH